MPILDTLEAIRRWMRYRNNLSMLTRLDDRILRDIGLNRAEIQRAARDAAA